MSDGLSPAARKLRRHREEMELALGEGLSLGAARARLAQERVRRLAACGTADLPAPATRAPQAVAPRPSSWMDRYENY